MKMLFALLASVILTIPLALYRAYWLIVLWGLSAVQYYATTEMTLAQALTVTYLAAFVTLGLKKEDEVNNNYTEFLVSGVVKGLVVPPIVVGTFWLVSKFI